MLQWFAKRLNEAQKVKRDERGFTLIELLVVVIIIGILAAIAIPTFLAQRDSARQATQESDLRNLASTATACAANNNGVYDNCNLTALNAAPYNFNGSSRVQLAVTTSAGNTWTATARHQDLPSGQNASYTTTGATGGRVIQNGY